MRYIHNCAERKFYPCHWKAELSKSFCNVSVGWKQGGFSKKGAMQKCRAAVKCGNICSSTLPPPAALREELHEVQGQEMHPELPLQLGLHTPRGCRGCCGCSASSGVQPSLTYSPPHTGPTALKILAALLALFLVPEPLSWQKTPIKPNKLNTMLP